MKHQKLSLISYFLLFTTTNTFANDFTSPKLIESQNPTGIQETYNGSRIEGWTLLNYVVDKKGLPKHIEVVNASSNNKYTKYAIRFLKNYTFTPATQSGEKVFSAQYFFMKHNKAVLHKPNQGLSVGFTKRYDRAKKYIFEKNFDEALNVLNKLRDSNAKNLPEQALSAWLHSIYYYHQKNWFAYRDNLLEAYQLRKNLPLDMAIKASQNLLQWQTYQQAYSDAVFTLVSMENIEGVNIDIDSSKAMLKSLVDSIDNNTVNEINTTLSKNKAWVHSLPRSTISLSTVSGQVELAQLRCKNAFHSFESVEVIKFTIPDNYLHCSILIKGKAGTEVKFVEQGKRREFETNYFELDKLSYDSGFN